MKLPCPLTSGIPWQASDGSLMLCQDLFEWPFALGPSSLNSDAVIH